MMHFLIEKIEMHVGIIKAVLLQTWIYYFNLYAREFHLIESDFKEHNEDFLECKNTVYFKTRLSTRLLL